MKKALFPGSFDPPTLGHIDLIERGSKLFDKLFICVTENSLQFSIEERLSMIKLATSCMNNVEVISFKGLLVDVAKRLNVDVVLRGIRSSKDFEYEYQMAAANRQMSGIETIFLSSSPQYSHLSSTLVREIIAGNGNLKGFIPEV